MKKRERQSRFRENILVCSDWDQISKNLNELPKPLWSRDEEGEVLRRGWIFRGHQHETYRLKPSIERSYPYLDWPGTEYKILLEFMSKARMHLDSAQIPRGDDKLGWLALIQHYGAPTRLLDFTYSPYVALYFALRGRAKETSQYAEVWGLDEVALRQQSAKTSREADIKVKERKGQSTKGHRVSMRVEDFESALQQASREDASWNELVRQALSPCGTRREHFNRSGFIGLALPTVHNRRLSSQQGLFLFSGAEDSSFEDSLDGMMKDVETPWYKRFRIPEEALDDIERQLFQLNIHELSLFPDVVGLAGFICQKVRLHW